MPALADSRFHDKRRAGREQSGGLRNKRAVSVKSVGASVQRITRVIIAHLSAEAGDFGRADIGRIRHHQIEHA